MEISKQMVNKIKVREMLYGQYDPYSKIENLLVFDTSGWAGPSCSEFSNIIKEIKPKLIIEVGTWLGATARFMANLALQHYDDIEVVCIDTWLGSVEHWINSDTPMKFENGRPILFNQFMSNTIRSGMTKYITPFPIDSVNGAYTLYRLGIAADLIFIDAGHEYESVAQDLKLYFQLLRSGGVMVVDDIHYPPIQRAMKDVLGVDIPTDAQPGMLAMCTKQ